MLDTLPTNGLDMLARSFGPEGYRKTPYPPVALVEGEPHEVYYLHRDPVVDMADDTPLVWSWPGNWRNDVYQTTLGAVRDMVAGLALDG